MTPTKLASGRFALEDFTHHEMMELGSILREIGDQAKSMDDASAQIVRCLYENLVSKQSGKNGCALVRFFKSQSFATLEDELRQIAQASLGSSPATPEMKCLVLLATSGERSEWNVRSQSKGHRVIPLPNEAAIQGAPMIAQLVAQMGLDVGALVRSDSALMLNQFRTEFNVFHVPAALGSLYVPAQDFVREAGVKSVVGFGGLLQSRDMFAVILFSKVPISRPTAELFSSLGLMVKLGITRFDRDQLLAHRLTRSAGR
ncbi:MAG: hypothetical protein ACLPHP_22695 [Candidatus Sulfotelmatobacter sp.]